MQLPSMNTPIDKCIELAEYASRMFGKFPQNSRLSELSQRMIAGGDELETAQRAYESALRRMLVLRVDVTFEDQSSDRRVRGTQKRAEIEDGSKNGRLASRLFPRGTWPITRLIGDPQVVAMRDLEARLVSLKGAWAEAEAESIAIADYRRRYEQALDAKNRAIQENRTLRLQRDAAKEKFLDLYIQIANLVRAEFPRDRKMQDLFFDQVRKPRSSGKAADDDAADSVPDPLDSTEAVTSGSADTIDIVDDSSPASGSLSN